MLDRAALESHARSLSVVMESAGDATLEKMLVRLENVLLEERSLVLLQVGALIDDVWSKMVELAWRPYRFEEQERQFREIEEKIEKIHLIFENLKNGGDIVRVETSTAEEASSSVGAPLTPGEELREECDREQAGALIEQGLREKAMLTLGTYQFEDWREQERQFIETEEEIEKLCLTFEKLKKDRDIVRVETSPAQEPSSSGGAELRPFEDLPMSTQEEKKRAEQDTEKVIKERKMETEKAEKQINEIRARMETVEKTAEKQINEIRARMETVEKTAEKQINEIRARMERAEKSAEKEMNEMKARMERAEKSAEEQIDEMKARMERSEKRTPRAVLVGATVLGCILASVLCLVFSCSQCIYVGLYV